LAYDEPIRSKLGLRFIRKKHKRVFRFSKLSTSGYMRTGFLGKTWYVHRLVAAAFLPNPERLREVNHKNCDKTDNRPENLEWVSSLENHTHARVNGLYPKGTKPHLWKYDVDEFARLYFDEGLSTHRIAALKNIYPFVVSKYLRRAGYKMRKRGEKFMG